MKQVRLLCEEVGKFGGVSTNVPGSANTTTWSSLASCHRRPLHYLVRLNTVLFTFTFTLPLVHPLYPLSSSLLYLFPLSISSFYFSFSRCQNNDTQIPSTHSSAASNTAVAAIKSPPPTWSGRRGTHKYCLTMEPCSFPVKDANPQRETTSSKTLNNKRQADTMQDNRSIKHYVRY